MDHHSETTQALSRITDEGLFERLATSVLRQAAPGLYASFTQPGVNPDGKTVKSPVDAIAFVPAEKPAHMVVAHHTCGAAGDLRKKWLHDPTTVVPRKGPKPTGPAGDIVKTLLLVEEERKRTPDLRVTLALTTTREPSEDLTRDANKKATDSRIEIDIWSGSRIAEYLDNNPDGQWLRERFLGIAQQRLSRDFLNELSRASLDALSLMARTESLIDRQVDGMLAERLPHPVAFLVGESGFGKTVACYRLLQAHVEAGGCALVVSHDTLEKERTLDQALDAELRRLRPGIESDAGVKARALCGPDDPLLILVEDIKWSDRPGLLLERLAAWASATPTSSNDSSNRLEWQLLCPVWPQVLASASEEARKRIDSISIVVEAFTEDEARAAIRRNVTLASAIVSPLEVDDLLQALGRDPLLLALYDYAQKPEPGKAIAEYITSCLRRLAGDVGTFTLTTYREALIALGCGMLQHRRINPVWMEIEHWSAGLPERITALRQIAKKGDLMRLVDTGETERLVFRHDRVRASILTLAAAELMRGEHFDSVLSEPFFADVIGSALVLPEIPAESVEWMRTANPLALVYAFKEFREPTTEMHFAMLGSIEKWLEDKDTHDRANRTLRWAALSVLSDTESSHTRGLTEYFRDLATSWECLEARFRNGDVQAGIEMCLIAGPGVGASMRDSQIAHAIMRFGDTLVQTLDGLLRQTDLIAIIRTGALRLAGFLAEPSLADAIILSWTIDQQRAEHLDSYLWAAAECCGDEPEHLLGPVCDAWAALSDATTREGWSSPRNRLASHEISWAFMKALPPQSLLYFIDRAKQEDLRWPITFMLRAVDHPDAVAFIAHELAATSRRLEGNGPHVDWVWDLKRDWERRQREKGKAMSSASRNRLKELWTSNTNDEHILREAFRLWAATRTPGDIELLQTLGDSSVLEDDILRARLERGDRLAIPGLVEKLRADGNGYWWQFGREIWSDALSDVLNESLRNRGNKVQREWGAEEYPTDWITSELVTSLEPAEAERILMTHWEHLQYSPNFVHAALYVATPTSCALANEALAHCPDIGEALQFVSIHFGTERRSFSGVVDVRQLETLVPYLDCLDSMAIHNFWDCCNRKGWFEFRRTHFDPRIPEDSHLRASFDEVAFNADLDRETVENHRYYVDHWIKRHLDGGMQLPNLLSRLGKWLQSRGSLRALEFVADVVAHVGERRDLEFVSVQETELLEESKAIIADARFAVFLRTLI